MHRLFILLFMACSMSVVAQPRFKGKAAHDTAAGLIASDTVAMQLQHQKDSIVAAIKVSETVPFDAEKNGQAILELQRENTARQKRDAYKNIAIGVAMAVVLVIGLMRRRKKNPGNS